MIAVRRDGLGWFAKATAPEVKADWENLLPMSRDDLVRALCERGAHPTDAWDAVLDAEKSPTGLGQI